MSTKPNVALTRFGSPTADDFVEPPSGLRDTGFVAGTPASAGFVNALFYHGHEWDTWLDDGDCAFHNLSATGTLIVAGTTTHNGGLTVATGQAVALSGTTTLTVGTGAVVFGGTLTTAGAAVVGGQALTFTSFTFTANASTDQLAATGHPLQTGDGLVQVSNSGGGLPGGLVAVTNYWAIRIDANNFKLATSRANAIGGDAIDITSAGTGTQTLAATGSTVRPADAEVTRSLTVDGDLTIAGKIRTAVGVTLIGSSGIEQAPDVTKVSRVGAQLRFLATRTGTNGVLYPIVLPVGSTLATLKIAYDRAGNSLAFSIVAQDIGTGGAASSAQILVNDSSSSGIQAPTVSNFAADASGHPTGGAGSLVVRADRAYWVLTECTFTSGTPIVYGLSVNA